MVPGALGKRVSSRPWSCSEARYSKRSRVCAATRSASSEPSSQGYSCLSMYEQVGPGTTISRPCRTSSARLFTLSAMSRLASVTAPPSRYGMPQQRWAGRVTSTPFFSSTVTAALPVAGSLYSTEHVAKSSTRSRAGCGRRSGFRPSNHRENVSRWNGGRVRRAWMAPPLSINLRVTHTPLTPIPTRGGGAADAPAQVGVSEEAILQGHALRPGVRGARPQHQARKVHRPAVRRGVRAVVEAELALVAEVDDLLDVGRGELLHVAVHRVHVQAIEHHLERRAERQTAPAACADVVDPAQLRVDAVELPELRRADIECHRRLARTGSRGRGGTGRAGRARPGRPEPGAPPPAPVPTRRPARWPRPAPCPRPGSGPC